MVLRVQEKVLGAVAYSLVTLVFWPRRGGQGLRRSAWRICDLGRQILGRYQTVLLHVPEQSNTVAARNQIAGLIPGLENQLTGAI